MLIIRGHFKNPSEPQAGVLKEIVKSSNFTNFGTCGRIGVEDYFHQLLTDSKKRGLSATIFGAKSKQLSECYKRPRKDEVRLADKTDIKNRDIYITNRADWLLLICPMSQKSIGEEKLITLLDKNNRKYVVLRPDGQMEFSPWKVKFKNIDMLAEIYYSLINRRTYAEK